MSAPVKYDFKILKTHYLNNDFKNISNNHSIVRKRKY